MKHRLLVTINCHGATTGEIISEVKRKLGKEYSVRDASATECVTKAERIAETLRLIALELEAK